MTITTDRPASCIAPTPSLNGYKNHHCRCTGCTRANRDYHNKRARLIAYNQWQPFTDAEPARLHVRNLMASGLGWQRIADLAGISRGAVSRLLYGSTGRPPCTRIRPENAAALLAVTARTSTIAPGKTIDATGTRRRTQALAAIGWSVSEQARRLGRTVRNHSYVLTADTVQIRTAEMVKALYDDLSTKIPPPGYGSTRSKLWAQRNGFAPPLAWDDDAIDDPAARPDLGDDPTDDVYDETTVQLAVDGHLTHAQLATHRPDLVETIRRLAATGLTDLEIAHRLHWPGAATPVGGRDRKTLGQTAVCQIRARHHIPAPTRPRLPVEHHSTRNRRARRTRKAA